MNLSQIPKRLSQTTLIIFTALFLIVGAASPVLAQEVPTVEEQAEFSDLLKTAEAYQKTYGMAASKEKTEAALAYGTALLKKYPRETKVGYGLAVTYSVLAQIAANQNNIEVAEQHWNLSIWFFGWVFPAYQNDLQLNVAYGKAMVKTGVFFGNQGNYQTAVQRLLGGLKLFGIAHNLATDKATITSLETMAQEAKKEIQNFSDKYIQENTVFGEIIYQNGTYKGDLVNNKKHGTGTYVWNSGGRYVGDYVDDFQHGKGTYTWPDGNRYVGDFVKGERTGKGTLTRPSGGRYVGDFLKGEQSGKGTYTWPGGDRFEGNYVKGKAQGWGTYTYANGSRYIGNHAGGVEHGKGKFIFKNGDYCDGEWRDGVLIGGEGRNANGSGHCYKRNNTYYWDN